MTKISNCSVEVEQSIIGSWDEENVFAARTPRHKKTETPQRCFRSTGATGFEPAISGLTGRHVKPLHHAPVQRNYVIIRADNCQVHLDLSGKSRLTIRVSDWRL